MARPKLTAIVVTRLTLCCIPATYQTSAASMEKLIEPDICQKQEGLMRYAVCLMLSVVVPIASAADHIKIGFISTLSGPNGAIGIEIRDGFNLALDQLERKIGGLPAEVVLGDDR